MDWNSIANGVFEVGITLLPYVTSAVMFVVGTLVFQLIGRLPAFMRVYAEKVYRDKEADMRHAIEQALLNGLNAAIKRGRRGDDALSEAIDHAMRTNPDGIQHFTTTSGMTRDTLKTQAAGLAAATGVDYQPVHALK